MKAELLTALEAMRGELEQVRRVQAIAAEESAPPAKEGGALPRVTNIRHWSTPDYTRVAIDLEDEESESLRRVMTIVAGDNCIGCAGCGVGGERGRGGGSKRPALGRPTRYPFCNIVGAPLFGLPARNGF